MRIKYMHNSALSLRAEMLYKRIIRTSVWKYVAFYAVLENAFKFFFEM